MHFSGIIKHRSGKKILYIELCISCIVINCTKNTTVLEGIVLNFSWNVAALNTLGGVSCVGLLPLISQEWALVEYACNEQLPVKVHIHCLIKPVGPTDYLCMSFCSSFRNQQFFMGWEDWPGPGFSVS